MYKLSCLCDIRSMRSWGRSFRVIRRSHRSLWFSTNIGNAHEKNFCLARPIQLYLSLSLFLFQFIFFSCEEINRLFSVLWEDLSVTAKMSECLNREVLKAAIYCHVSLPSKPPSICLIAVTRLFSDQNSYINRPRRQEQHSLSSVVAAQICSRYEMLRWLVFAVCVCQFQLHVSVCQRNTSKCSAFSNILVIFTTLGAMQRWTSRSNNANSLRFQ